MLSADEYAEFSALYAKTAEALFRKAYRMCHGHHADAEDAHQKTYIKALEHWHTVGSLAEGQRSAWLAKTLAREVLQIWRAPHRSQEIGSHEDAGRRPCGSTDAGDEAVLAADRYHKACRAIARLKGRQRDVIALHCLAGYEISEVAEILGMKRQTVRVHLHAGRQRLAEMMAREEDQPDGQA